MSTKAAPKTTTKAEPRKIIFGDRPDTFAPFPVKFIGPKGNELIIPGVVYKYRTRSEFGELADAQNAEAYVQEPGEKFSVVKYLAAIGQGNVATLLDCIESWGLDVPVDADTLTQMMDECPAAAAALWAAYGGAARDGRLGN